jgi:hypothetical protein
MRAWMSMPHFTRTWGIGILAICAIYVERKVVFSSPVVVQAEPLLGTACVRRKGVAVL